MRTHHTSALRTTGRLLHTLIASALIACTGAADPGLTNPSDLVPPAPLLASSVTLKATNPDLPVYIVHEARTVPYRSLSTPYRGWVDETLALLLPRSARIEDGCNVGWISNSLYWHASCTVNGYTCNIDHSANGHKTSCKKEE